MYLGARYVRLVPVKNKLALAGATSQQRDFCPPLAFLVDIKTSAVYLRLCLMWYD